MGGEKLFNLWNLGTLKGSPPHGRGKVPLKKEGFDADRITPAWAGKSFRPTETALPNRDHPRMGGEKRRQTVKRVLVKGSPPHGRGKDPERKTLEKVPRITPAWAGKSEKEITYDAV